MPASQPASALLSDQSAMNCGSSAGTVEYPAMPRISAPQTAAMTAVEGPAGRDRGGSAGVTVSAPPGSCPSRSLLACPAPDPAIPIGGTHSLLPGKRRQADRGWPGQSPDQVRGRPRRNDIDAAI